MRCSKVSNRIRVFKRKVNINEYLPPSGYTFYRFAQVENEVNVVCQGSEKTEDKFGRNDWNFTLNVDTGEWKRQSLAY